MSEKRKEFTVFLESCAARCKEQAELCSRDGREDEAVFEKIKLNVYDIFKTVFNTLGEGEKEKIQAKLPDTKVSVFHEIVLHPGEQYTLMPGTKHWFQGGEDGAVISEFSTRSTDETDQFTDERLVRMPQVEED